MYVEKFVSLLLAQTLYSIFNLGELEGRPNVVVCAILSSPPFFAMLSLSLDPLKILSLSQICLAVSGVSLH